MEPRNCHPITTIGVFSLFLFAGFSAQAANPTVSLSTQSSIALGTQAYGVAVDPAGDVFVAESAAKRVVEYPAGCTSAACQVTVPLTGIANPDGVAVDQYGTLYIMDYTNNQVVQWSTDCLCVLPLVTGLKSPEGGLWASGQGLLFIADTLNHRVIKYDIFNATQSTVGTGLAIPYGVAADQAGNAFITDYVNASGYLIMVPAGCTTSSCQTNINLGSGVNAWDVALDGAGNVFVAINYPAGLLEFPAGCKSTSCMMTIPVSGMGGPTGLAVDQAGNLYIGDATNNQLVKRNLSYVDVGTVTGPNSSFYTLQYTTTSPTEFGNFTARVLTEGVVNQDFKWANQTCTGLIAQNATCNVSISFSPQTQGLRKGSVQLLDASGNVLVTTLITGTGLAPVATFPSALPTVYSYTLNKPGGMAIDPSGYLLIADTANGRIVRVPTGCPNSSCETVAVSGLNQPEGLAVDSQGNFFVSSTATGNVIEIPANCSSNSCAVTVGNFPNPAGVALDQYDNLYIATPFSGNRVLEIPRGCASSTCYLPIGRGFGNPAGIAVDLSGNVFVANSNTLVEVYATGGQHPLLNLSAGLTGMALDASGNLYVTNGGQAAEIPRGCDPSVSGCMNSVPFAGSPLQNVQMTLDGIAVDGGGDILLADSANNQVYFVPRAQGPTLNFPTTNVGQSSTQQEFSLHNIGNLPLTAVSPGMVIDPNFQQVTTFINDCSAGFSLAPGATCNLAVKFKPLSIGAINGGVTFTDNNFDAPSATQGVTLNGTGQGGPVTIGVSSSVDYLYGHAPTFLVDGAVYNTSQGFTWTAGTTHNLLASSPQSAEIQGIQYVFTNWSDGSTALLDTVTAPFTASNYVANYKAQLLLTTLVNPPASGTISPNSSYFGVLANVNVTAAPNPGYVFTGWSIGNANFGTTASTIVNMTNPTTITANFAALVQVTVGTNQPGLSFTVDGTAYTSAQTFNWAPSSTHTVASTISQTLVAGTQYNYTGWSDGGNLSHTIHVSAGTTSYTVNFNTSYLLTVAAAPTAGGTASPASGTYYPANTVVNLNATANAGYAFTGWTGNVANAGNAATTVTMSAAQTVTAGFAMTVPFTINTSPSGASFTVDGTNYTSSQTLNWIPGTSHSIGTTAQQTPSSGTQFNFTGWSDSGALSHAVTAPAATATYTASFNISYQLTTSVFSPSTGSVSPASGGYYPAGTVVSVTGTPNSGYGFYVWQGNVANVNSASTTVTMNAPQSVTVVFGPATQVTVGTNPPGLSFNVDGTTYTTNQTFSWLIASYHTIGTTATQNGTAGTQYAFNNWSDAGGLSHQALIYNLIAPLIANFNTSYQLTTSAGAGGTVSPATGAYYASGTAVPLTATPNPGYSFGGWTGPVANASNASTTVTMSGPQTVAASFVPAVQVTVGTSQPGLSFTVDNTTYSSPQTLNWVVGSNHTIATSSPQSPTAGTQYTFTGWSDSGAISHSVTASAATNSYTAGFSTSYLLMTAVSLAAGGSVSPITGTYYASGTVVNLSAAPNSGYAFTGWTGSVANANSASTTVTMNAPQSVMANYVATVQVTVGTNQPGLSFSVDGTPFTAAQTLTWNVGSNHTLATTSPQTVIAGTQYTFTGWSDSGAISHSITAPAASTAYTAGFSISYQLKTAATPAAGGTVSPATGAYFTAGSSVNLVATPAAGYVFSGWTGPVANPANASTTVTMNATQSVTANFTPTVQVIVGTNPAGLGFSVDGTAYSTAQTLTWTVGSQHTIGTTTPQALGAGSQYKFTGWSDTGAASHTVTASSSTTNYTAAFSASYLLTTGSNPSAGGSVSPATAYYTAGTAVPLVATPAPGYIFSSWTGAVANANVSSTTVAMTGPQTVTANFVSALTVGPPTVDFGTVYLKTVISQTVTVTNSGTTPISMGAAQVKMLSGGNPNQFMVTDTCGHSLAGQHSCVITIKFTAGAYYTPQTATLTLSDGAPDGPHVVALSASVIDPEATFNPNKLTFPPTPVNTTATKTVTLTNPGATALTLAGMSVTGANASAFTASSDCGTSVTAGGKCTITVTFTPTTKTPSNAQLDLVDNAQPATPALGLAGAGH